MGREDASPEEVTPEIPLPGPDEGGTAVLREDGFCRALCRFGTGADKDPSDSRKEGRTEENIYKSSISVSLCFDKITGTCRMRSRRPGDTVVFGGMTRRVKTLFSDRKMPERIRDALPVFEDGDGIVWIPGFPPRDGMRADQDSRALCVICRFGKDSAT